MSPQTRRGRATSTGDRRSSARQRVDAQRRSVRPTEPLEQDEGSLEEFEYEAPHRGILDRARRSTMLRSLYGFTRVYIPFVLVFIVLLGGVFVYKNINPDVTLSQRWMSIQRQWKPKIDDAVLALSNDFADVNKVVADYGDLKAGVQGWLDAVGSANDWGSATAQMQTFIKDTNDYAQVLAQAAAARTSSDLDAVLSSISTGNQTMATEVATVSLALGLNAFGQPTLAPGETASPSPSPAPSESSSAGASGSPAASASGS